MYSTTRQTQTNLVSSFVVPHVVAFYHLYFLSSTYQRKAYRVYNPPSQVHCLCIPSYPPTSLSRIPLPLPPLTFKVEISRRFQCFRPSSLLNQLHALFEEH